MSCDINIDLKVNIHDAALDSCVLCSCILRRIVTNFHQKEHVIIRNFIRQLDEQIEANLPEDPEDHDH